MNPLLESMVEEVAGALRDRLQGLDAEIAELRGQVKDLRALVDSQGDTIRALSWLTFPAPVYPSPDLLQAALPGVRWQPPRVTIGPIEAQAGQGGTALYGPATICGTAAAQGSVGAFRPVDPVEWTRTALVKPSHIGALVEQGRELV